MHNTISHALISRGPWITLALFCCLLLSGTALSQASDHIEDLERAAALINSNRIAEAEDKLNQILKSDPNDANALNLLGTIRARQEKLAAAEGLFVRALHNNPKLAGAHLNLAHIYLLKSDPRKTADELKEVLRLEPLNAEAAYRLASLMLAQGEFDDCVAFIETTKQTQTLSAPLLATLGDAYLKKGELSKAEEAYRHALQLSNRDVNALLGLVQISYSKAELQSAADYMSQARAAAGASADLLYTFALVAMKVNLKADALAALKTAIEIKPTEPSYRFALGTAWLKAPANLDEAEESFRAFLKLRPEDARGQLHLGYVLLKQKRFAESRVWIEKTTRTAATPESFYYLGLIAQGQDDDASAIRLFQQSIKRAPSFASAHVALGASYLKLKDFPRAQQALETGVKLSPEDSKAHYNLALLYSRLDKKDKAAEEMRIVQRLNAEKLKREGKAPENNDDIIMPPTSP